MRNKTYLAYRGQPPRNSKRERIPELDFIRGFAIFMMILDHLRYDMANLPSTLRSIGGNWMEIYPKISDLSGWCDDLYYTEWYTIAHYSFVILFFLVSGICVNFSRNHWQRSLFLAAVAYAITAFLFAFSRYLGMNTLNIYMGVLNVFALAHVVYSLKYTFLKGYISDFWFAGVFLVIAIAFYNPNPVNISSYDPLYVLDHYFDLVFGQAKAGLDYFYPIPFIAVLFFGAGLGKLIYKKKKSYLPFLKYAEPFPFLGRRSLEVYIIHQPVLILVLTIMVLSMGYNPL